MQPTVTAPADLLGAKDEVAQGELTAARGKRAAVEDGVNYFTSIPLACRSA